MRWRDFHAPEQKAVKTSAFDLQTNPQHPSLQMHRIENSRDRNFWSVRVNSDVRIIVHRTEASLTARLCRSSRQGLCLGGSAADRGASEDWRSPDRGSARAGGRYRAARSSCSGARSAGSRPSFAVGSRTTHSYRSGCRRTGLRTCERRARTLFSNSRLTCRPRHPSRCCNLQPRAFSRDPRQQPSILMPTPTRCDASE